MKPITKYLSGGDITSYFVGYTPFLKTLLTTTSREKSSAKESDSQKVGIKDLLGLVKELKGLPVDTNAVIENIKALYEDASLTGEELSTSDIVSTYLSTLRTIRIADYNQKEYEKARDIVGLKDGLNEVAIDNKGRIFVLNLETGEISRKTVSEYNKIKNSEKYLMLTNNNLLYFRAHDPNFAFKNEILGVVSNGIGMSEINKLLFSVISRIGTNTLKSEGYSERTANDIIQGVALLEKNFQPGMTVEGLYKQGILHKDQYKQAEAALKYLWSTLPLNAKSLLKVKGGSEQGALALMLTLTFSSLDETNEYTQSLIKNPNSEDNNSKSSKKGSSSSDKDKSNPYFNMVKQIGGTETPIIIRKGNTLLSLTGTNYSSLPDMSGKPIESTSIDDLLNRGLSGIVTDRNAITFGNQVVKSSDLTNIMYDNSGGTMVILPCKKVNGRTVVDLDIIDEYEDAANEIQKLQNPTEQQIAEIYVKHGLMELVDLRTGLPNRERVALFLVVDAYAVNKNDFLKNSDFVEEVVDPDDTLINRISNALSTDKKKNNYEFDPKDKFVAEFSYDEIYKGTVYIPVTINELQAITAFDKNATNFYQREQDYQDMMKRISAGSSKANEL